MLPLLFIIAIGGLDEGVRDEALRILTDLKRKETNWSSQQAVEVAKIIIQQSQETEEMSNYQKPSCKPLTTCLHIASIQWVSLSNTKCFGSSKIDVQKPMSHVLKWLRPNRFVKLALENCRCRSKLRPLAFAMGEMSSARQD